MSAPTHAVCQCSDPQCTACHGKCEEGAVEQLFRVDMHDPDGTSFCADCANDAWISGLFIDDPDDYGDDPEEEEDEP